VSLTILIISFTSQITNIDKSLLMSPEPDDLKILIAMYRTMDIEELKGNIDN